MKKIIVLLSLFLSIPFTASGDNISISDTGIPLLENYRFEDGGYSIAGMVMDRVRHKVQEELGNFFTDDIEVLNEMKASWVTDKASPMFACGYHYEIFVIKDGNIVASFAINLDKECNTVATRNGYYYFDPQKLIAFKGKLKKPEPERKTFSSLAAGREYISSLTIADNLLMFYPPNWAEYDGEFDLDIECEAGEFSSPFSKKCISELEEQITAEHPDERFILTQSGYGTGGGEKDVIHLTLKCRKTLYNELRKSRSTGKWKDYSPAMTVLWKTPHTENGTTGDTAGKDCDNFIYYSCNKGKDILRVYDQDICRRMGSDKDGYESIRIRKGGKPIAAKAECVLKDRTYRLETSTCRAGDREVPIITVSAGDRTVFTGSYGDECGDAEPLIYFHHATSNEVEIGKRMLLLNER